MSHENRIGRRRFIQTSATGVAAISALTAADILSTGSNLSLVQPASIPDRLVVLTFDDAVKSHRTVVAPLLKELGFGATFFVTHRWMEDAANFMNWQEIAEIHQMGFEIGNHSWTHDNFSIPQHAARLRGELALVENDLDKVGVPRPVSFAYPGNMFGPEEVQAVMDRGYKLARRGITPEIDYAYGENQVGPTFDPRRNHPLLIPSTGIPDPAFTFEHFQKVVTLARDGQVVVLQFHGVPDRAHAWYHTPPESFRKYMAFLEERGYQVIALRDLEKYLDLEKPPADPHLKTRFPKPMYGCISLPTEVQATQADMQYWLEKMLRYHRYTVAEASQVCGVGEKELKEKALQLGLTKSGPLSPQDRKQIFVLPYPGGRHPRIGFLDGAYDPLRGTKASVFLPWDTNSYAVVDLPEALFSNLGLIFLAHTHIPTVWNDQNQVLENIDWNLGPGYSMNFRRTLPNGIVFGASIRPVKQRVEMELWLRNVTDQGLSGLATQICVLLKGAPEFNSQTNDNKILQNPVAAVRSLKGDRWILTGWEQCGRVWANPSCPCMHSDPRFPDCPSGQAVRLKGQLWFYEGEQIERELERFHSSLLA